MDELHTRGIRESFAMTITIQFFQHATADVNVMLLGAKQDLESKREIEFEDGKKVWFRFGNSHFRGAFVYFSVAVCNDSRDITLLRSQR